jgi:uncharacterized phiE125 gp8 family phage protein
MALKLITGPAAEPLTVADTITKLHLRVDSADEDSLLPVYISAARRMLEQETSRRLITQTWTLYLDEFPDEEIDLQIGPVQSVSSVKYVDEAGVQQTVSPLDYALDTVTSPGWVLPTLGKTWPSTRAVANAVEVTFVCGYGATGASVPEDLILWMLLHVSHWYENRAATTSQSMNRLPFVARLLDPYRIARI